MSIFILPPSIEELERRLRARSTDTEESILKRLSKAEYEMGFSEYFDYRVVNDNLDKAAEEVESLIKGFIENNLH